jgi:hypothetical protein
VRSGCERYGAEIASQNGSVNRKGKAKVRVSCGVEHVTACNGKLVLISNGKQIGKGKYKLNAGAEKKVSAKLSKKGRKALAKSGGTLLVDAEARTNEPPGASTRADEVLLSR